MHSLPAENTRLTRGHWMALASALLGWLFDGAEMGVFPLVGRSAIGELLHTKQDAEIGVWFGAMMAIFLVGAATGGVLFGWLGDRIGRVRAMALSILTYAIFTGACGIAQSVGQIGALRFLASLGMGGEWSLGVAIVMEIWPNKSRPLLAGLIGAAANLGYMLIAFLGMGLSKILVDIAAWLTSAGMSASWVEQLTGHQGWRLLMISGVAPACLTFLIRIFVPESEKWREEHARGATSYWKAGDLAGVAVGAAGGLLIIYLNAAQGIPTLVRVVGSILGLLVALGGYLYPIFRYVGRAGAGGGLVKLNPVLRRMLLAAALSGVPLLGTWAAVQWAPTWADQLTGGATPNAKAWTQVYSAGGATVGACLAALVGGWLGRRVTYAMLSIASMASILFLYQGHTVYGGPLLWSVLLMGFCTASFYGWLPLYLPELFPTSVRATGQGFGYNFGRVLAAIGALQTGNLLKPFNNSYAQACSVASVIYLLGLVVIFFAPETRGRDLVD